MNISATEVSKFEYSMEAWWDPSGTFKTLHDINPLRLQFMLECTSLKNKKILDVGCGAGLFSENLAKTGAAVTGIDAGKKTIEAAQEHARQQALSIDYIQSTAEPFSDEQPDSFDIIVCFELLEHVPDPASLIRACTALAKPNGDIFFSTLNRNLKSYMLAILSAEYILKLLPRGTHDYAKFIRPSELEALARQMGLKLMAMRGLEYEVFKQAYHLSFDVSVNYFMHFKKQ